MKFQAIYRASFYLMLTFATLVMSIDATEDNKFAMLYPLVVAVSGIVAFLTVDRRPRPPASRFLFNVLALMSSGLCYVEYLSNPLNPLIRILAPAHWLVYLQLIKMFMTKSVEDDWFLFLLGLVQVLVGGVMSQSDQVGIALFCWALMALWVLTLFALRREELRMKGYPMAFSATNPDRSEPYQGLIDFPFMLASLRVTVTTLALGGMIFLAMPRRASMSSAQMNGTVGKHLSGFDDKIRLGQLGEILENDSVVMSIELFDREGQRITPDPGAEYRWRGVSMDHYETGSWERSKFSLNGTPLNLGARGLDARIIRQVIKLEPTDSPVLFNLRPFLSAEPSDRHFIAEFNDIDGTLFRSDPKPVTLDYSVISSADFNATQPTESYPSPTYQGDLLRMSDALKAKLRPIALEQVKEFDENDVKGRAIALERFLRDSGQFRYSLQMGQTDPDIDPVEDFLINRKSGHCEYFASSLALLLRSIDIPSRMINGFKGGDFNAMGGVTTVRQKHAHSWVEALVANRTEIGKEVVPFWFTLDPTPADQRNESVAKVGGVSTNFRQLSDFVRYIWIFYIVGFNSERQDRFLYKPIRELVEEAKYGFSLMGEYLRNLFSFPSVESFFSLRGFTVSFLILLILVGLIRVGAWYFRKIYHRISGKKTEHDTESAGITFYRRLLELLREYGLERPPAETPREFARRAAIFLAGHGSGTETVADVPPLVVDAFYRIRFGEHTIIEDDFSHLTARLDALEAGLHPVGA